ncbi:MAG: hypothetical protein VKJ06_01485 [Vampirovibrionales bacterium]|nr:hypothetical protein [Vampirovibrionales bacterium]
MSIELNAADAIATVTFSHGMDAKSHQAVEGEATLLSTLDAILEPHQLAWPLGYTLPKATLRQVLTENLWPTDNLNGWQGDLKALPKDWVLGGKVRHADGQVTKWGGKVVKNVSGYDMRQLYIGGHGRYGTLCEVTLLLVSRPEAQRSYEAWFNTPDAALNRAQQLESALAPWLTRLLILYRQASGAGRYLLQTTLCGDLDTLNNLEQTYDLQPLANQNDDLQVITHADFDLENSTRLTLPLGCPQALTRLINKLAPAAFTLWPQAGWLWIHSPLPTGQGVLDAQTLSAFAGVPVNVLASPQADNPVAQGLRAQLAQALA